MKEDNVVCLKNVSKIYNTKFNTFNALNNADLSCSMGKLSLLLGPSGSGKTTLLTIAAGFNKNTTGDTYLFGKNISDYSAKELQNVRARRIGFIFQTFLLIDSLNVYQNVELVLKFSGIKKIYFKEKINNALEKVGILHLAEKRPEQLSHGEKQRASIARAFANDADLVIADEPTASLEIEQGEKIIQLLHLYSSVFGKCVIVASHDLRLKPYADRIFYIENGFLKD